MTTYTMLLMNTHRSPSTSVSCLVCFLFVKTTVDLFTPPFPPQVQVRPVTPVTSICQVSSSRLCIWHVFFCFVPLISFFFDVFPPLPSLVFPSNPSGVNAMSSQEAEFEMTAWKTCHPLKAGVNIWPNIFDVFRFYFGRGCLYLCLIAVLLVHRSSLCK